MIIKIKNKILELSLKEDRAILMVCIGIALVFWILVKLSQTYRTEKNISFQFELPEGKTFTTKPPDDLQAELEGTGWDLIFEYFTNPEVVLSYDLMDVDRMSLNRGQLRSDIFRKLSSDDLKITEVNYDNLNFLLEEKVSKKVPLNLRSDLSFSPEYDLAGNIKLDTDSVEITGPSSLLDMINSWDTDSLVLSELKSSQNKTVQLETPPRELTLAPKTIELFIPVEQFTEKSIFLPVDIKNPPDSMKVFPEKVKLTCVVGLSNYNSVVADSFAVEVDFEGITVNQSKNTAPISLTKQPTFVKQINFTPKSAEFFIIK